MDQVASSNTTSNQGRILIVDNDPNILALLCEYLLSEGYEAYGCPSGREALEVLQGTRFDLMLVDLVMPGMNGAEVLKASAGIDPSLIGIIITGHGTIKSAVDTMKMGAFDYILKPFNFPELLCSISRALEMRRLRESEAKYRVITRQLKERVAELEKFCDKAVRWEFQKKDMKEEIEKLREELKNFKDMEIQSFYHDLP